MIEAIASPITDKSSHARFARSLLSLPSYPRRRYYDNDRRFMLALRNPTGEASLGPQHRTIVTIKDDDKDRTTPFTSYIDSPGRDYTKFSINSVVLNGVEFEHNLAATESVAASWTRAFAGVDNVFNIAAMSGSGAARSTGGDVFLPEVVEKKYRAGYSRTSTDPDSKVPSYEFGSIVNNDQFRHGHRLTPIRPDKGSGGVVDNSDGSYTVTLNTKYAGNYELHVYQVVPGGFLGHYYDDPYFSPSSFAKRRVDASLNFNWDMGKVTTFGKDFVSAWWTGKVKVPSTNSYTFTLEFDDNVRMFLDGALLVDMWDRSPGIASAEHTLEANVYHDVMIEYRDVVGDAHLKLYWESAGAGVPYEIVPKDNMYYVEDISGSPYNYTVVAGDPDGPMSTARGKGLYKATAGLENKFVVEARDAFGNWRGDYNNGYGAEKAFHDYMLEDIAKVSQGGMKLPVLDRLQGKQGRQDINTLESLTLRATRHFPPRSLTGSLARLPLSPTTRAEDGGPPACPFSLLSILPPSSWIALTCRASLESTTSMLDCPMRSITTRSRCRHCHRSSARLSRLPTPQIRRPLSSPTSSMASETVSLTSPTLPSTTSAVQTPTPGGLGRRVIAARA